MTGLFRVLARGWLCLLLAACSGTPASTCHAGYQALRTACVPILDDCREDEVPLLGGGCKKVGLEECTDSATGSAWGIKGPPDWKCKPIGPPATCRTGWRQVTGGWCEPLLPASPCPAGSMEVLGKSTCQLIGDCGGGTWGKIKTTSGTIFVDRAFGGDRSDGSRLRPFTTLAAALGRARSGGHLALAAGTYGGDLQVSLAGITLEGRCARMVTINGQRTSSTFALKVTGDRVTLRGLTVGNAKMGVQSSARDLTVERLTVQGCSNAGIAIHGGDATIRDTLVVGNTRAGVDVWRPGPGVPAPAATLERVVVRDVKRSATGFDPAGSGVLVDMGAEVDIKDSLVTAVTGWGIMVNGSTATLEGTVVSSIAEEPNRPAGSAGVWVQPDTTGTTGTAGRVTLRGCLLKGNQGSGAVAHWGGNLVLDDTVVYDNRPSPTLKTGGQGIRASISPYGFSGTQATLTIRGSLVTRNHGAGVVVTGSVATIERSVVSNTRPLPEPYIGHDMGYGIQATVWDKQPDQGATLTLRDSLLAGNTTYALDLWGSRATLQRVVVRDTKPGSNLTSVRPGLGLRADTGYKLLRPRLKLADCLVKGNHLGGVYLGSADATVERTVVRDQQGDAQGRYGVGIAAGVGYIGLEGARLTVSDSVLLRNDAAGIDASGAAVTVEGSVVSDTGSSAGSSRYGIGIIAGGYSPGSPATTLDLSESLLSRNHAHGVLLTFGARATVRGVVTSDTAQDGVGHGDGLVAAQPSASLAVTDSLVQRSARAGLIYSGAGGRLERSAVRGCQLPVVLDRGASPTITSDTVFLENTTDLVARTSLDTARPPRLPPPPGPPGK